jgi:RND family efflux transporter MFP subunit
VLPGCQVGNAEADAKKPAESPKVGVVEARTQLVPVVAEPNGTTRALNRVSLRARVRGFLDEIAFMEGQDVTKDQLLFVIEEEPFQVALAAAKAKEAEAAATLERAKKSQAREIAGAQVDVDLAERELARVEEARQKSLLARKAASQQDYDRASAAFERDKAKVEVDKANLEQAKIDYDINILSAQANLDAAKAAAREAEIDLAYCRMTAPINGRVGESKVTLGNLVGPAAGGDYTELATLQQLDPMGVDIQVASRHLLRASALLARGMEVRLLRPSDTGPVEHPHVGRATFIDNTIDPNTSTFLMRASIANPDRSLLPGEFVRLRIQTGELPDALVVPERALMETQGGKIVYTIEDSKVKLTRVESDISYEGLAVIESGLEPGTQVIVDGLQFVRPGMNVTTSPADWPVPAARDTSPKRELPLPGGSTSKSPETPAEAPSTKPAESDPVVPRAAEEPAPDK